MLRRRRHMRMVYGEMWVHRLGNMLRYELEFLVGIYDGWFVSITWGRCITFWAWRKYVTIHVYQNLRYGTHISTHPHHYLSCMTFGSGTLAYAH
jgi:hypothetical protein